MNLTEKSTDELRALRDAARAEIEAKWAEFHAAQAEINRRVTAPARDRLSRLDDKGRPIENPEHPACKERD